MLAKARIVNYDRQSDAPNCSVTYDRHYDDRNSFIIQATGQTLHRRAHLQPKNLTMLGTNPLAYSEKL
jgi:ribosomal protein L16 Arg81 hydroxylase